MMNQELIDYRQAGLRLVPDGDMIDRVSASNGLRPRPGWGIERGIMDVKIETLVLYESSGTVIRKYYEVVHGPKLVCVRTEVT